jgi:HEAT repeat protein/ATP/ADP translocase
MRSNLPGQPAGRLMQGMFMINRLATILKVRSDEGLLVLLVALLFGCIQAGQGLGDNAASALFLLRFGVDFLPYMYMFLGGLTFVTTLAYSVGLGRFERNRFYLSLILGLAVLLVVERVALAADFRFLYPVLWLTVNGIAMILGTLVWNVAGEVCDARQAKRLFPLFTSAGILGSVFGNLITGSAAKLLGTPNLLILYALLLGLVYFVMRTIAKNFFQPLKKSTKHVSFLDDLRAGFDYVRTSSLMRLIALASVLFSILFFAIAFPFSKIVSASFPDEEQVAGFFGLFNSVTTALTFLASLLIANRVYARLGIVNSVLFMPFIYILGFAVFAGSYSLTGAVIARFLQLVILGGIAGTAWNALFNVVPSQKRGQVLAFINGVPAQIGVALSGVLLIVAEQAFTIQQIFLIGTVVALVCGALVWWMRNAYAQALIDALRAGRLEVFSASETSFRGLEGDAASLQIALQALQDPKATTRKLAAEILGKMQDPSAIPALTGQLGDTDANVRASVIEALKTLRAESASELIIDHLNDSDEQVRLKALSAIAQFMPDVSSALIEKLTTLLNDDPSIAVQMQAASTLAKLGFGERVVPNLMIWVYSKNVHTRIAAIRALAEAAPHLKFPMESKPLIKALEDSSVAVRYAAIHALASFTDSTANTALVEHLNDAEPSLQSAAAEVLRQRDGESRKQVLEIFEKDNPAIDSALDALAPGDPQILAPLRQYAQREIIRARKLRNQVAGLSTSGRAVTFLRERLGLQSSMSEGRLIKTVGLFSNMHTMELVRKSMNGTNPENRAAALEALDTIGDKQLAKGIISLLEEEPVPSNPSDVMTDLLKSTDPWLRILAVRSFPELGLREFIPVLHQLKSDPDTLLQEAAYEALSQFGEVKPMATLKTVSMLERILLLREIPIFSDLSPEDLKRVAEIAHEEWYPQNTIIFRQGDEGNMMFVIVEGRVQIVHKVDEKEKILAERTHGDFVGEMAIIESAPRLATLRTQTDVRVLALDDETFKGILRERPEVSLAVLRSVSRRLREMTEL